MIAGIVFERTRSASLTLTVSGGYLFSGLMFGPDLDIYSQQYKRWGIFRWIWLPYRRSMRHRSFLSHGFLIGTVIRVIYLLTWIIASLGAIVLLSAVAYHITGEAVVWSQFSQEYWTTGKGWLTRSLQQYPLEWVTVLLGLELGALSHSLSDWIGSRYKRRSSRKAKKATPSKRSPAAPNPAPSSTSIELPTLPQDSKFPPFQ